MRLHRLGWIRLVAGLTIALGICAAQGAAAVAEARVPAAEVPATAPPDDAQAAAELTAATQALQAVTLATVGLLEGTRRTARSTAEWLARGVDSWFGDIPFAEGGKITDGRLSLAWRWRQDEGQDVDLRFNAHFHLPNVERFGYLFVGRDDPREVVRDTPDAALSRQQLWTDRRADRSFIAGLGVRLRDAVDFRVGLSSRAKPYAQARVDLPWNTAPGHLLDIKETLFWTHDDRFGATTALSYEVALSPTLAVRWLNAGTITQVTKNMDWSSSLGAYKLLGGQCLLSLEALFSGTGTHGEGVGASDRGLLVKWEQPVYQDWLFAEIVGGHFWPRRDATSERSQAWAVGGTLKMRF